MKIKAIGIREGKKMTVEIVDRGEDDYSVTFNGKKDARLNVEIDVTLLGPVKTGGTYYPTTLCEKLCAIMEGYFFDRGPDELYAEGITFHMPEETEEGVVY